MHAADQANRLEKAPLLLLVRSVILETLKNKLSRSEFPALPHLFF